MSVKSLTEPPWDEALTRLSAGEARALAQAHGLSPIGVRPGILSYLGELWRRRSFVAVLAGSRSYARNQNTYLGQLWTVLNPTLNALVYALIFGILIQTDRGLTNVVAFIVVGTFTFRFFEQSVAAGARAISGNLPLLRSVVFPRAVLPAAGVAAELVTLVPALCVMCVFAVASGLLPTMSSVPVTARWFLLVPAILLLLVFNAGIAFVMARWASAVPDIQNLIPFAMRLLMYGSGVLFSIDHYVHNAAIANALSYQPVAVYLNLVRSAVLSEPSIPVDGGYWLWGCIWAVVTLVVGFVVFWRGEERYGRD